MQSENLLQVKEGYQITLRVGSCENGISDSIPILILGNQNGNSGITDSIFT